MPIQPLLERLRHPPAAAPSALPFPRRELAVAALLVEAAQVDRRVTAAERATVARLVRARFALPEAEAQRLLEIAGGEFAAALDDWVFTQAVREGFPAEEREAILEMIWAVVYADGELARFEDLFMLRMAAALGLEDAAADRARVRAYARSGGGA